MPIKYITNNLNFIDIKHYYYLIIYCRFSISTLANQNIKYTTIIIELSSKIHAKCRPFQYAVRVALSRQELNANVREDRYEITSNFGVSPKTETRNSTSDRQTPHGWQLYRTKRGRKWKRKGITIRTAGQATQRGHDKKREYNQRFSRSLHLDTSVQVSGITNVRAFSHSVHCSHCKY